MFTHIYYDPRQNVEGLDSYSPSAGKPKRFAELVQRGAFPFYGHGFDAVIPVTQEDLLRVHAKGYVDGVFSGTTPNGFDNADPRVPESCLWTIGSLLAAARAAIRDPASPACSPSSGFHHAGHAWGGGYCTFNGLMVVAAKLIAENPGLKVGILDCDFHYGNGTDDILERKPELADQIIHRTSGAHFDQGYFSEAFFEWLRQSIQEINDFGCDVVLYQAGADMHIKDPLGGLLNDAEMIKRDRMVFEGVQAGVAWNLAGGYREIAGPNKDPGLDPVLATHRATLRASTGSYRTRLSFPKRIPDVQIRAEFHKYLVSQGFAHQVTPMLGQTYSSSHVQALWDFYFEATIQERKRNDKKAQ